MKKVTRELKNKSIEELVKDKAKLATEITKLKLEFKSNPPKDTNLLSKKKKRMAAILTMMSEKKEIERMKEIKNLTEKKSKKT